MWTAGEDFEQMEKVHRRILDEALQNLELIIFCSSGDLLPADFIVNFY